MAKMVISGGYRSGSPQDALRNEWGPGAAQLTVSPLLCVSTLHYSGIANLWASKAMTLGVIFMASLCYGSHQLPYR